MSGKFDDKSARRIARVVRKDEQEQRDRVTAETPRRPAPLFLIGRVNSSAEDTLGGDRYLYNVTPVGKSTAGFNWTPLAGYSAVTARNGFELAGVEEPIADGSLVMLFRFYDVDGNAEFWFFAGGSAGDGGDEFEIGSATGQVLQMATPTSALWQFMEYPG